MLPVPVLVKVLKDGDVESLEQLLLSGSPSGLCDLVLRFEGLCSCFLRVKGPHGPEGGPKKLTQTMRRWMSLRSRLQKREDELGGRVGEEELERSSGRRWSREFQEVNVEVEEDPNPNPKGSTAAPHEGCGGAEGDGLFLHPPSTQPRTDQGCLLDELMMTQQKGGAVVCWLLS